MPGDIVLCRRRAVLGAEGVTPQEVWCVVVFIAANTIGAVPLSGGRRRAAWRCVRCRRRAWAAPVCAGCPWPRGSRSNRPRRRWGAVAVTAGAGLRVARSVTWTRRVRDRELRIAAGLRLGDPAMVVPEAEGLTRVRQAQRSGEAVGYSSACSPMGPQCASPGERGQLTDLLAPESAVGSCRRKIVSPCRITYRTLLDRALEIVGQQAERRIISERADRAEVTSVEGQYRHRFVSFRQ